MNPIENFFDSLAETWDDFEEIPKDFINELISSLGIKKGDKVLDLACGTGIITGLIHDITGVDVDAIDLSQKMIEKAKIKYKDCSWAHFYKDDFLNTNLVGKYNFIVIYNAYPHFIKPTVLSENLAKHLYSNGKFAIVHSFSRERLNAHHHGLDTETSRNITPIENEAKFFEKEFKITKAFEDETRIILIGKLK